MYIEVMMPRVSERTERRVEEASERHGVEVSLRGTLTEISSRGGATTLRIDTTMALANHVDSGHFVARLDSRARSPSVSPPRSEDSGDSFRRFRERVTSPGQMFRTDDFAFEDQNDPAAFFARR